MLRIEGFVIVSAEGMLANAKHVMPDELKFEGDKRFFSDALEFQFVRHDMPGIRQHALGRHDHKTFNTKHRRGLPSADRSYSEMVCTTLETGRELTVGSFTSFTSSSSYCGRVSTGAFAFICTTL